MGDHRLDEPGRLLLEIGVGAVDLIQGVVAGDDRAEIDQPFAASSGPMRMLSIRSARAARGR